MVTFGTARPGLRRLILKRFSGPSLAGYCRGYVEVCVKTSELDCRRAQIGTTVSTYRACVKSEHGPGGAVAGASWRLAVRMVGPAACLLFHRARGSWIALDDDDPRWQLERMN